MPTVITILRSRPRSVSNYCTLRHGVVHYVLLGSRHPVARGSYKLRSRRDRATVEAVADLYEQPSRGRILRYSDQHHPH